MEKEFIPYEQALELKELGFNKSCFGYYLCKNSAFGIELKITTDLINLLPYDSSSCIAPTYSQVFRWFREKYNYVSYIKGRKGMGFDYTLTDVPSNKSIRDTLFSPIVYDTYEEAELACLEKLIEIVKSKQ